MLLPLLLLLTMPSDRLSDAIASGDAHYDRRAEGAVGALARATEVDAAIAAYRRALVLDPSSLEARSKLIRGLFFRASFCGAAPAERKKLLEEARAIGDEGVARLDAKAAGESGPARISVLKRVPQAATICFWTAVAWGEWALARGTLAAARAGAGPRIRDLAQTVVDLDPEMEQGGGYRILGRLHDQSPRIPLLTGWVSHEKALVYLRQALELGPHNTVNQIFLAEAILSHDPSRKDEARRLLEECAGATPRPEYRVEDASYSDLARKRLAGLR